MAERAGAKVSDEASRPAIAIEGSIERLAPEWDSLADRLGASPFMRPGWFEAWWSAFRPGRLELITVRQDGRLAGVVPTYRRAGVRRSATNDHTAMFGALADGPAASRKLARALFASGARRAALAFVERGDAWLPQVRASAARVGWRTLEQPLERSPYIRTDGDIGSYEATLSSKLRSEVRRRRRRLEEDDHLWLEVVDGSERLDALLGEGLALEAAAWKAGAGTAIESSPATRAFYGRLTRWAADRGILRMAFLRHGGRAIAFDLCLESGGVHYLLKTGYDPAYRSAAPGIIIRREMISRAFSTGLASYEFLGHDHAWKLRWTNSCRERVVLQAFAPSLAGSLDRLVTVRARPLAKRLLRRR